MNYRVFRWLIIAAVASLLLAIALIIVSLLWGLPWQNNNRQFVQLVQAIVDNQGKLISGSRQVNELLNIPSADYRDIPKPLNTPQDAPALETPYEQAPDSNPLEIAFYDALQYLEQNQKKERSWAELNRLLDSESWQKLLEQYGLRFERSENAVLLFPQNEQKSKQKGSKGPKPPPVPRGQAVPAWFELKVVSAPNTSTSTSSSDGKSKPADAIKEANALEPTDASEKADVPEPADALAKAEKLQILLQLSPDLRDAQNAKSVRSGLELSPELREFLQSNSKRLYTLANEYNDMYNFLTGRKVTRGLAAKRLKIESLQPEREDRSTSKRKRIVEVAQTDWEVRTRDEQVLAQFYFDIASYQVLWNDKPYQSLQLLESDWDIFIEQVDTRTLGQRHEDEMRKYLLNMLQDPAFLLQMKNYGLHPADLPPREDEYYEYYDLLDAQDRRVASFALQKRVGEAYLMDRDDVEIRSLKSFINGVDDLRALLEASDAQGAQSSNETKNLNSAYVAPANLNSLTPSLNAGNEEQNDQNSPKNSGPEAILLIGTHDNLADVIMLVFINKQKQNLSFLSIPRDLYFRNAKINSVYQRYGSKVFMDTLSQIVGLPITKYVKIDMYAFVEVVNLIGGVDVYLEEDLIDPQYKIKQMGRWQTLVMRKGEHHLDGLGALRYARSRHTSNDFERSERQQIILEQVTEKLQQQLSRPQKLLPFLQVAQKYMVTNFTLPELALYWLEYGGYQRSSGNTINTKNLLYYTYTNYIGLSDEKLAEAEEDEEYPKGAFILLPRDNNWNLIRRYVQRLQNS